MLNGGPKARVLPRRRLRLHPAPADCRAPVVQLLRARFWPVDSLPDLLRRVTTSTRGLAAVHRGRGWIRPVVLRPAPDARGAGRGHRPRLAADDDLARAADRALSTATRRIARWTAPDLVSTVFGHGASSSTGCSIAGDSDRIRQHLDQFEQHERTACESRRCRPPRAGGRFRFPRRLGAWRMVRAPDVRLVDDGLPPRSPPARDRAPHVNAVSMTTESA